MLGQAWLYITRVSQSIPPPEHHAGARPHGAIIFCRRIPFHATTPPHGGQKASATNPHGTPLLPKKENEGTRNTLSCLNRMRSMDSFSATAKDVMRLWWPMYDYGPPLKQNNGSIETRRMHTSVVQFLHYSFPLPFPSLGLNEVMAVAQQCEWSSRRGKSSHRNCVAVLVHKPFVLRCVRMPCPHISGRGWTPC